MSVGVLELARRAGVGQDDLVAELAAAIDDAGSSVDEDAICTVLQAYGRAVGRIAEAEAEVVRQSLVDVDHEERPAHLTRLLQVFVPVGVRGFHILHRALLRDALEDVLAAPDVGRSGAVARSVALVDVVGSAGHLARRSLPDVERFTNALFAAGLDAVARTGVRAIKYVGDGVFLLGRDTTEVAGAALSTVRRLQQDLPFAARAGVAHGTVLLRAGDVFGLPVNTAQLVTKRAAPGALLADPPAARRLAAERRGRTWSTDLHPALGAVQLTEVLSGG